MSIIFAVGITGLVLVTLYKMIYIVPEQKAYIIQLFGKYQKTLGSGLHFLVPFLQKVAYKQDLKEEVIDVDPQICITADNVQVTVDGILYLKVVDAEKASYGIENYRFATAQLAKTTMRSEIGKLDLDRSFSERDELNNAIVRAVDEASDPWGIKVTRYEIRDIAPTMGIQQAMKQQMRAEREKRAEILTSEGVRESRINISKGDKEEAINISFGDRQKVVNESSGRAEAIQIIAEATADSIRMVAEAINEPNGQKAMNLRITEDFIVQLGDILEQAETQVLPHDMANIKGLIDTILPGVNSDMFKKGGTQ